MELIKKVFSQKFINIFYHLPKAVIANVAYGFPTKKLKVVGITGTDGKTTTTNMVYQILRAAGKKVSMVSTINAVIAGRVYDTGFHVTSPDPFTVQKFANQAKENGDEFLILEVTSHSLDQFRFWGINFEVGVITNITHEHLDYHKTFENYMKTKFKFLENTKIAVLNQKIKDDLGDQGHKMITFGLDKGDFNQKELKLKLGLPGDYNIENALAAFAVTKNLGIEEKEIRRALQNFSSLPGRMEEIKNNKGIRVVVDFAHTPNGLEQVLKTLRSHLRGGKLIAIFGAASKRDVTKRPIMGKAVGSLADYAIITAEDPRGEPIKDISRQIAKGVDKSGKVLGKNYWMIDDRKQAIEFALNLAKKGDTIGIFGKGHEQSINLDGIKEVPWSDVKVASDILWNKR